MYAANVDGTRELLKLAREVGVRRVVYTSSVATMGFKADGTIVDEETPVSLADMIGHYKRSKFLGEQEAIAAAQAGQHVMILNPTTPIGAGDAKPTPTGQNHRRLPEPQISGVCRYRAESGRCGEVARMHVVALERGTPGERYILGGENLTLKQILDRMSAITGLPSPTMKVPHAVAMAFAFFDENITGKLRGKEPRATVEAVRMGKKMMFASSAKAERELGFRDLPVYQRTARGDRVVRRHMATRRPSRNAGMSDECPAIIAALPREVKPLVRGWTMRELAGQGSVVYTNGSAVVACAGMGAARAALAVQAARAAGR